MSRLSIIAKFLFAIAICSSGVPGAQAQEYVQWSFDLDQATQVAASENKLVLLHFTATWCGPCKELDRFVFVNPTTIRAISTLAVPVKIDVDVQKFVAEKYQVTSVPTDVIMTTAGHVVSRQPSPRTSDGYLQMLSHAKAASENLTSEAIAGQSNIRQAMTVNQSVTAPRNPSENQSASGGNFSPNGVPIPGQFPAAENSTVTNKFFPQNQIPNTPAFNGPGFAAAPGSIKSNSQSEFVPVQSLTVKNEYATGNGMSSTPGNFGASPNDNTSGMNRMQNPYVIKTENNSLAMDAISETTAPTTNIGIGQSVTRAVSLPPIGLDGYCGVTLMEDQRWVKGTEQFGCIHRGKLYFFASQEHLDRFQMTPDMFSPLLGGADPVAFHDSGKLIEGKRKLGIFYGEPGEPSLIVLFDSESNRESFEADPPTYVQSVRQAMSHVDGNTLIR